MLLTSARGQVEPKLGFYGSMSPNLRARTAGPDDPSQAWWVLKVPLRSPRAVRVRGSHTFKWALTSQRRRYIVSLLCDIN